MESVLLGCTAVFPADGLAGCTVDDVGSGVAMTRDGRRTTDRALWLLGIEMTQRKPSNAIVMTERTMIGIASRLSLDMCKTERRCGFMSSSRVASRAELRMALGLHDALRSREALGTPEVASRSVKRSQGLSGSKMQSTDGTREARARTW